MKQLLKSIGLEISMWLMDVAGFLIGLCSTTKIGWWFDAKFRLIESLAHWLFGISYQNSREEINDALTLGFDTEWRAYTDFQLQLINAFGLKPDEPVLDVDYENDEDDDD